MSGWNSSAQGSRRRLTLVFLITAVVLVAEIAGGILANSLALLADAGHMLTDTVGIGLALIAVWLGRRPVDATRTYGYARLEVLAALANAVILVGLGAFIVYQALRRLSAPAEITTDLMLGVALVGLAANAVALRLLHGSHHHSLVLRAAYLEVASDLAGSLAVIAAAIVIALTGWAAADTLASALIGAFILPRAWSLLRDTVDVLLEAVPRGINLTEVRSHLSGAAGVAGVHDLHAWAIASGLPVVSAHVVLDGQVEGEQVLRELRRCMESDFSIQHATFQLEAGSTCLEGSVHP